MSTTDSPDDADTHAQQRALRGIHAVKLGITEAWLIVFGLFSMVGYGVRDAFDRRFAVGVIYMGALLLVLSGSVALAGFMLGLQQFGLVGAAVAIGFVLASTLTSVALDDTANRDYRHHIARHLPIADAEKPQQAAEAESQGSAPDTAREQSAADSTTENTDHDTDNRGNDTGSDGDREQAAISTYVSDPPETDFEDVAGFEELKTELHERVIDPLQHPDKYEEYGLSVENGFLLYGPPGTGKTYLSKALAGELEINYIGLKGSDIISKWLGEGTQNVATLFEEAREHQPCLIFIDEIDALTPKRSSSNQHQDQTQTVNQFLEEISEINDSDDDIVIVAATNRRDQIDPAMLRSGRLSVQIEVTKPNAKTRVAIFDIHLDAPRDKRLDAQAIAQQSSGLTAADMEQVATEAARSAMRRGGSVTNEDVATAIKQVRNAGN